MPAPHDPALSPAPAPLREDPLFRSARREAACVLVTWALALTYTVGYCTTFGYGRSMADLKFVLGFPDWIFWGIVAPWAVCIGLSCWFAFVFMSDEDLGEELETDESGFASPQAPLQQAASQQGKGQQATSQQPASQSGSQSKEAGHG